MTPTAFLIITATVYAGTYVTVWSVAMLAVLLRRGGDGW